MLNWLGAMTARATIYSVTRTMADAMWKEYELFCPVCGASFRQLVVLHNRSNAGMQMPGKSNHRSFGSRRARLICGWESGDGVNMGW
jgi:hypothetical protein